jgi:uncharacterized membrane protein YfcA
VAQALGHISKIVFYGGLVASAGGQDWLSPYLLSAAIIASIIGTTLGKRVLDNMRDASFFTWTQRILLSVGAVLIGRAIYLLAA